MASTRRGPGSSHCTAANQSRGITSSASLCNTHAVEAAQRSSERQPFAWRGIGEAGSAGGASRPQMRSHRLGRDSSAGPWSPGRICPRTIAGPWSATYAPLPPNDGGVHLSPIGFALRLGSPLSSCRPVAPWPRRRRPTSPCLIWVRAWHPDCFPVTSESKLLASGPVSRAVCQLGQDARFARTASCRSASESHTSRQRP